MQLASGSPFTNIYRLEKMHKRLYLICLMLVSSLLGCSKAELQQAETVQTAPTVAIGMHSNSDTIGGRAAGRFAVCGDFRRLRDNRRAL